MQIDGSVVLVTGGASGLGEATVRQLVSQGGRVVIVDLNAERGKQLAAELGEAATFAQADVSNADEVQAAVEQATSMGPLRAAINCAGIGMAMRTIGKDGTNEPVDGERGVVVNTASIAAFDGQIGQIAYSASKGGIVGMTLPAARDLSKAQIRVVTIAPGTFDTPLLGMLPEEMRAALAATIPHPSRLGRPQEFGALACHIVENGYINGEVIRLDGAIRMAPR
ncbi:MAG: SDR family NAD(P)-dependent oxidoreductase [Deltaproteobacteria bacterium]|nr:SDR family NAD(P)-dependent oxidoreductase [Deltaproteobacteria bacterium]